MKYFLTLFSIISIFILSACGIQENNSVIQLTQKQLKIVTTIPPLYSFTAHMIEGTPHILSNLVPAGISAHDFQMTPLQAKQLETADIVIINGLNLELFLSEKQSNWQEKILDTSKDIVLLPHRNFHEESGDEHGHEDYHEEEKKETDISTPHDHGTFDPHIWLAPKNAILQSQNIYETLTKIDPENSKLYAKNFATLQQKLTLLDQNYSKTFENKKHASFLNFHDAYQYLEKSYGIINSGVIQEIPGNDPSVQDIQNILKRIEEKNVQYIFTEPQFSPKTVQMIKQEKNIQVLTLDPLGSEVSKDGYFQQMEKNLQALKQLILRT